MMNYLALGDSYTYGELIPIIDSFPYQLVAKLRRENVDISAPEIIAKTAWTTTDLLDAIARYPINQKYSFCTLLIGVNNQYQGKVFSLFQREYDQLLEIALSKVEQDPSRLVLLNIPDWGMTPFNKDRDAAEVSAEINAYNAHILMKSEEINAPYIEICTSTRDNAMKPEYLASDGLHPSAKEYEIWAEKILTETLNPLH